jgi:uncharacterized protein (DUF2147 family)
MRWVVIAIAALSIIGPADAEAPSVMGVWLSASKVAEIEIAPCADAARGPICGTVVKLHDPKGPDGNPIAPELATDANNVEPGLRGRKVIGIMLLYDFKTGATPNSYVEGTIYNGENGKTYRANVSLEADGTLKVRGYIGRSFMGETQIWTRVR